MSLTQIIKESVERFRNKIYEPVHEEGVTCWCKPMVTGEGTTEGNVMTITHNEERELRTKRPPHHEVYVRSYNGIKEYNEDEIERYSVRHKYLSEEEKEWQSNGINGY